jgi:F420-non-reducing hydrogenase iron-sulfur subunit
MNAAPAAPAEVEIAPARSGRLLIIATLLCSYPGIDATGQAHMEYSPNTYVIPTPDPVIFPESFYLHCFEQGIDAILIASCGTDSPYVGSYDQLAARVNLVYQVMKARGLDIRRLKLTAICSVCMKAFVKEVESMTALLDELGPVDRVALAAAVPAPGVPS